MGFAPPEPIASTGDPVGTASAASLLRVAAPMVMTRGGLAMMMVVDSIMLARHDGVQLSYAAMAGGTFGRVVDVFMAVILSALVIFAAHRGKGESGQRIAAWQRSAVAAIGLGLLGAWVSFHAGPILLLFGQDIALVRGASPVIAVLGLGLPAGLVAVACAVCLEATGRPGRVAIAILLANVANLALNWVFIGGHLDMPALGAVGSALSTTLVRVGLALVLLAALLACEGPRLLRPAQHDGAAMRRQFALGSSALATMGGMHALGIWLTIFAGWLGDMPLAAFSSVWILTMPILLLGIGVGDAVGMRAAADTSSWSSGEDRARRLVADIGRVATVLLPLNLIVVVAPSLVSGAFTADPVLRAIMTTMLPLTGLVLMADGISYALVAGLRGHGDIAIPAGIQIGAMALTPLLGGALAFGAGLGVQGLMVAIALTSTMRLALLIIRFFHFHGVWGNPLALLERRPT